MKRRACVRHSRVMLLAFLCLSIISLGGCTRKTPDNIVRCADVVFTSYPKALAQILPTYSIESVYPYVFTHLEKGIAAEAFEVQAASALQNGVAKYWYPQYLATAIIAVDRDKTDAYIESWNDLLTAEEIVGYVNTGGNEEVLMAAIAYGLEGDNFTLTQATDLLGKIYAQGNLVRNTFDVPIVICFDYQAVAMIKSGRNMEIIVPSEGTYTYQKGILSNTEISFPGDADTELLTAGLRLPDKQCDDTLYPDAVAYENADLVRDYTHMSMVCQHTTRILRRSVFHTRIYSSADQREHQYFVMLYLVIIIIWTASFIRRAMQKGVRRAALFMGVILLSWIIVRLIKYQFIEANSLNRFFWYAYYLFQLSLPLVVLWLAWAIDRQDERAGFPKWLRPLILLNTSLVVLVFTNDWHGLVFRLDTTAPNWSDEYIYDIGYCIVLFACVFPLMTALVMMLVKSGQNPRKSHFVFPLFFSVLLLLYGYGYITKIPIARDSDFTMTVGLFTLLFVEVCFRTRLIPVNTKYTALFTHSPLGMQLFDKEGRLALKSQAAIQIDKGLLIRSLAAHPLPVEKDDATLIYASPITGGTALWQEDVSVLSRLHHQIEESVRKLKTANSVLAEEEKMRRALDEEKAKAQLMAQLETEIAGHISRLAVMIEQLRNVANKPKELLIITLLLCYIKRRCNLFFCQLEADILSAAELAAYMDELAEIAGYGETKILFTSNIASNMSACTATLFYDFFYAATDWAVQQTCLHILLHLSSEKDVIILRLLSSVSPQPFIVNAELEASIIAAGGSLARKDLDDTVGISLFFPKGVK